MNKETLKLGVLLFTICAVSTILLAGLNAITLPVITANSEKIQNEYRGMVLPGADSFENAEEGIYFGIKGNEKIGVTVNTSANGYGGAIEVMTGIDKELKVTGVKILSQSETAGLGANCTGDEFLSQYVGKTAGMKVVKTMAGETEIQAISGATRTTNAVTAAVEEALKKAKEVLK